MVILKVVVDITSIYRMDFFYIYDGVCRVCFVIQVACSLVGGGWHDSEFVRRLFRVQSMVESVGWDFTKLLAVALPKQRKKGRAEALSVGYLYRS